MIVILCKFDCYSTCLNVTLPVCEVESFLLNQSMHVLDRNLEDDHWGAKLAYMAESFEHMHELIIASQGINRAY